MEEAAVKAEVSYLRSTFFADQPVEFPMKRITGLAWEEEEDTEDDSTPQTDSPSA